MDMRTYLNEFFAKIDIAGVPNDTASPKDPVNEGEIVIGVLNDELKKMFVLTAIFKSGLKEKANSMTILRHKLENSLNDCDEQEEKSFYDYFMLRHYMKMVDKIFWVMVRESMPKATYEKNLDIREKWQVVTTAKSDLPVVGPIHLSCRFP
ncbi:MAG: hypothetical protein WCK10_03970 [Candidatus Staskawiczbacteria bacterium]